MSFQDLDFKSDRACLNRPENSVPVAATNHLNPLVKLLLISTIVMLLGFSVSNWQSSAKAADSTPKLARLHYSLPLPESEVPLEQNDAPVPSEIETSPWESVTIKSGRYPGIDICEKRHLFDHNSSNSQIKRTDQKAALHQTRPGNPAATR